MSFTRFTETLLNFYKNRFRLIRPIIISSKKVRALWNFRTQTIEKQRFISKTHLLNDLVTKNV